MTATRLNCKDFGYGCPYPVGDVLMRQNNNDPKDDWPGTAWSEIGQGRFPIGANSTYGNGSTGDPTHKHTTGGHALTPAETATKNHSHTMNHGHTQNAHNHGVVITGFSEVAGSGFQYVYSGSRTMKVYSGNNDMVKNATPTINNYNGSTGGQTAANGASHSHGDTGSATAVPPWFGVRFWKRTA